MLNKAISPIAASLVVAFAFLGAVVYELNALDARDRQNHPVGEQTREFCLHCHSGPEWLAKIAEKEGKQPGDRLFVNDPLPAAGAKTGSRCPAAEAYRAGGMTDGTTYNGK
ncbi:MAG TPA: hypothetical protein VKT32_09710 [Chthonomonadaceae bacterium]|nr:hypothetical protein [Chthonomonadaceae bacterium]